jgi:hypothetical protein
MPVALRSFGDIAMKWPCNKSAPISISANVMNGAMKGIEMFAAR